MFTKSADETVSCMREILKEAGTLPETVYFDRGSELKNRKIPNHFYNQEHEYLFCNDFRKYSANANFIGAWYYAAACKMFK